MTILINRIQGLPPAAQKAFEGSMKSIEPHVANAIQAATQAYVTIGQLQAVSSNVAGLTKAVALLQAAITSLQAAVDELDGGASASVSPRSFAFFTG